MYTVQWYRRNNIHHDLNLSWIFLCKLELVWVIYQKIYWLYRFTDVALNHKKLHITCKHCYSDTTIRTQSTMNLLWDTYIIMRAYCVLNYMQSCYIIKSDRVSLMMNALQFKYAWTMNTGHAKIQFIGKT